MCGLMPRKSRAEWERTEAEPFTLRHLSLFLIRFFDAFHILNVDKSWDTDRRYASYDDFEGIELASTILIDKKELVRWKRTGGDPFSDVDFLLKEIERWNK